MLGLVCSLAATAQAQNQPHECQSRNIAECIQQWLENLPKKEPLTPPGDSAALVPLDHDFLIYHQALVEVKPERIRSLRQSILDTASIAPAKQQAKIFIHLSMLEFFSGYPERAKQSLHHASIVAPDDSRVVMLHHLTEQSRTAIEKIIRETGFAEPSCQSPAHQIKQGLSLLLAEPFRQLELNVLAMPDTRLRLGALFLLARYMEVLNPCLPIADYYDYRLYQELSASENLQEKRQLGKAALETYRNYQRQATATFTPAQK